MGATTFGTTAKGATARIAFETAVDGARYESGHGGYSGTIAEKREFVACGTAATSKDANAMAEKMIDVGDKRIDDKWGPAGCIEIGAPDEMGRRTFLFFGWASM